MSFNLKNIILNCKFKIIASASFICFSLAAIFLNNVGFNGYELSIYNNISLLTYFLIFLTVFGGFNLIILSYDKLNKYWKIGYLILILSFSAFLFLPIIKGYYFYSASDVLTHLGTGKDFLISGHFNLDDFYPIMNIFTVSFSLLTDLSLINVFKYFTPFYSVLFLIGIYLMNSILFREKEKIILSTALSIIPFYTLYFTELVPNGFSFMMVPLILYFYFKEKVAFSILIILYLIITPFSHPLTSLMLIIYFLTIEIAKKIYSSKKTKPYKMSFNLLLILVITFFTWISTSFIFVRSITKVLQWTRGELYAPTGAMVVSIGKLKLSTFDQILLFLKMYGSSLIPLLLSLVAAYFIIKRFKSEEDFSEENIFAILLCGFITVFLFFIFMFTGDPNFQAMRSLNFIFLLTYPLGGYGLYEILKIIKTNYYQKYRLLITSLALILACCFLSGAMALYYSPHIYQPSDQMSEGQYDGMSWFFEHKNSNINSLRIESAAPYKYAEAVYGLNNAEKMRIDRYGGWTKISDHLGYNNFSYIGQNYTEFMYFPLSNKDRRMYPELWSSVDRYTVSDFNKLQNDLSVNKIYSNSELDVWFIKPLT